MGGLNILAFLFLLLLFRSICAKVPCPVSSCANSSATVHFPFQLEGRQPRGCGYYGFKMSCNTQGITVVSLRNAGDFFVRSINYLSQEIEVYDPNGCLPKRLLDLNLQWSTNEFSAAYFLNYTFLVCPTDQTNTTSSEFTVIDCMSNSTNTTIATSSSARLLAKGMMNVCETIASLPVPVSRREYIGLSSDLKDDLLLTWDSPYCRFCTTPGKRCGYRYDTSRHYDCFSDSDLKENRSMIIFTTIVIPVFGCLAGAGLLFFCAFQRYRRHRRAATAARVQEYMITRSRPVVTAGLDESTIESYTTIVVGESRHVPGPNDGVCAICLSEYRANETVRCIPECMHCFHAGCIDQWLRMNTSCPVCRNSSSSSSSRALMNALH